MQGCLCVPRTGRSTLIRSYNSKEKIDMEKTNYMLPEQVAGRKVMVVFIAEL